MVEVILVSKLLFCELLVVVVFIFNMFIRGSVICDFMIILVIFFKMD